MQNIHPLFIHFPIALLSTGLFCEILGAVLKKESLKSYAWWCQLFGTIAIVFAVLSGLHAESTIKHNEAAHSIMERHKMVQLVTAAVFIFMLLGKQIKKIDLKERFPRLYLMIFILATGSMLYGAHLGGRLVYEFGVGGTAVKIEETHELIHTH